jgi:hypothetical protein
LKEEGSLKKRTRFLKVLEVKITSYNIIKWSHMYYYKIATYYYKMGTGKGTPLSHVSFTIAWSLMLPSPTFGGPMHVSAWVSLPATPIPLKLVPENPGSGQHQGSLSLSRTTGLIQNDSQATKRSRPEGREFSHRVLSVFYRLPWSHI